MNYKIKQIAIPIVIICIIITSFSCNRFQRSLSSGVDLTRMEKIKDFEYFYDTIITSYPMLDEEKRIMGLDFISKREYYLSCIEKTKNNYEFFSVLSSIASELHSFHTDLVFPDYKKYIKMNCYNVKNTLNNQNLKRKTNYWNDYLNEQINRNNNSFLIFSYIEGNYIYDNYLSDKQYSDIEDLSIITSINRESIIEFLMDRTSCLKYRYDHKRKQTYKTRLVFNDKDGEKVNIEIKNSKGEILNKTLYYSVENEIKWLYKPQKDEKSSFINTYQNSEFSYIKIDNFMNKNNNLKNLIKKTTESSNNIIIDLRGNPGGSLKNIQENLFTYLFSKKIKIEQKWYLPKSKSNQRIINELKIFGIINRSKDIPKEELTDSQGRSYSEIKDNFIYYGSAVKDKQMFFLIDNNTASASDNLVSLIKNNKLGKIIGINTHGEGSAGSFIMDMLPNSGLVFIYMPGISLNQDGTNNSLYGTIPDMYSEQTIESFYMQRNYQVSGIDINNFQSRIIWDNVLQDTIKLISNKE